MCMIIQEMAGMCVCERVGGGGSKKFSMYGPSVSAQQCCMHPQKVFPFSVELVVTLLNVPATFLYSVECFPCHSLRKVVVGYRNV